MRNRSNGLLLELLLNVFTMFAQNGVLGMNRGVFFCDGRRLQSGSFGQDRGVTIPNFLTLGHLFGKQFEEGEQIVAFYK